MTATEELEARRIRVRERKERAEEYDRARKQAPLRAERPQAEMDAYHREVGEGEPEDPVVEARISADLDKATAGLRLRVDRVLHEGSVVEPVERWVDTTLELRYEGALTALEVAQAELGQFIRDRIGDLVIERLPRAQEVEQACTEALTVAHRAAAEWEAERTAMAGLCVEAKREDLLSHMPDNPLRAVAQMPTVGALPIPDVFLP